MKHVYVLGGARTPFGSFGGALKDVSAEELAVVASVEAMRRSGIEPSHIDQVVLGNVVQSSANAAYMSRHVALRSGIPQTSTALTLNRLCGSGLQAVVSAAESLMLDHGEMALVGGTESMSQIPYAMHGARFGAGIGKPELTDMLWATLKDEYVGCGMGETAENLAVDYEITREAQDAFALRSHARAAASRHMFAKEIIPVSVKGRKGMTLVTQDEHIREETSLERLRALKPAFRTNGSVTAGNSSGINDGAAMLVLAGEEGVAREKVQPLARIISFGIAGVDPSRMGIGPVPALTQALHRANLDLSEMDLIEVNEAFASQVLAVQKTLGIRDDQLNPLGGAIALGHPVGASGARLLLSAILQLHERQGRFAAVSLCIGGGQGIAMIVERVS